MRRRTFGNTLSYINANGTGGASNATILKDTILRSSHEVTLLTDQPCDSSCGYIQKGSVAYSMSSIHSSPLFPPP